MSSHIDYAAWRRWLLTGSREPAKVIDFEKARAEILARRIAQDADVTEIDFTDSLPQG